MGDLAFCNISLIIQNLLAIIVLLWNIFLSFLYLLCNCLRIFFFQSASPSSVSSESGHWPHLSSCFHLSDLMLMLMLMLMSLSNMLINGTPIMFLESSVKIMTIQIPSSAVQEIMGSNPAPCMDVCPRVCVVLSFVGTDLATGWSPIQRVLLTN